MALVFTPWQSAQACSRILYETGYGTYTTGRSLDWNDTSAKTALWVFPSGLERDGGAGKNPIQWTSKYGSVGTSLYDAGFGTTGNGVIPPSAISAPLSSS